jgi:hypothetical protein
MGLINKGNTWGVKGGHAKADTTEEQAAAKAAWLHKEVPEGEGKLRRGFWNDLAKKFNKALSIGV